MSFLTLLIIVLCIAALFGGAIRAIGSIAIALVKYVIFPVGVLIAIMGIIKYGF